MPHRIKLHPAAFGRTHRETVDDPHVVAYSPAVKFTRRRTRSTLRAILPLLTLVWASLPLHHCNLAMAGSAHAGAATAAPATAAPAQVDLTSAHCSHHLADGAKAPKASMSCSDLGRAGPDLRPSVAVDDVLVHVSFDARWQERGLRPVSGSSESRPQDDGRWRPRPLHLQKSVLLI